MDCTCKKNDLSPRSHLLEMSVHGLPTALCQTCAAQAQHGPWLYVEEKAFRKHGLWTNAVANQVLMESNSGKLQAIGFPLGESVA